MNDSMIEIALPGTDAWKSVRVLLRNDRTLYVGPAGSVGSLGSLVMIRVRKGNHEYRAVARQTERPGRYDFIQSGRPAA
ncbi:MAG: hypothetical protein FJZ01_20325 [Candidatus Sericytochromatia bacterium]|nr:hypothetical protein [Candidatus Tanganyikabacteria bacterium]